jgi:hypothetical protein
MATLAHPSRRAGARTVVGLAAALGLGLIAAPAALADGPSTVDLGKAAPFAVLSGTPLRNSGPTAITGDVGVHPWPTVEGFGPGTISGETYRADKTAIAAKLALVAAYYDAAGRASSGAHASLGGLRLTPGVYTAGDGVLDLAGRLTLDAQDDPTAVWIFQTRADMAAAAASTVSLVNGAQACNVFWQVAGSATLGTGSAIAGTIMTAGSITLGNNVTLAGRAFARDGSVTLLNDVILGPDCAAARGGPLLAADTAAAAAEAEAPVALAGSAASAPTGTLDHSMNTATLILLASALVVLLIAVSLGEVPERRRPRIAS